MGIEENKKIVLNFFANFSAGQLEAVFAAMADTATWWVAGKPDTFALAGTKTKTQLVELAKTLGAAMPTGLRITPKSLTDEGDRVAVEAESSGETVTGKTYSNLYHFLVEVRDGKIQAVRAYLDTMHAQEVLVTQ